MTLNVPGVYTREDTFGTIPAILNTHDACYMFGSASMGVENKPVFVTSYDDFLNVFGASPSAASVKMFFQQRSGYGMYFIRVKSRRERTVTVDTFTEGTVLTLTVNSYDISYTCEAGETATTARNALGALVNQQYPEVTFYTSDGTVRYDDGTVVTSSANITLGAEGDISQIRVKDASDAAMVAIVPGLPQGFICAPEFFQSFTQVADRTLLQNILEAVASDTDINMISIIDPGENLTPQQAIAERNLMVSPRGHSAFYYPYILDDSDTPVPPSPAVIGCHLRRMRIADSPYQPGAGTIIPLYGVKAFQFDVNARHQQILNPVQVNCLRELPGGRGKVVYGARTLSTSNYYVFVTTRVVLNVLASSLRRAFDDLVFTLVNGQGATFSRIKQTCAAFCEVLRQDGALYGSTPQEAYLVICDNTNNAPGDLANGIVNADVIVKVSPVLERLYLNINRASIGSVLVEISDAATIS
jgi:uncharacterized protein